MRRIYLQKAKAQIARSNTIRTINTQIVLNYVREREPISRAEIAKETALQRSTVSSIVNSLVEEGFIEEIGAGASTGGRKPTLLHLRKNQPVALAVDITPTVTTVALANLAGEILDQAVFQTSPKKEETFNQIVLHLAEFKTGLKSKAIEIGISVPGLVDAASGIVSYVPYFHWRNWNLKQKVQKKIGLPVNIDNDANAIALAELWFGKAEVENFKNFISVLISEGIGTGIIFDGQIYRGNKGAAGEFGHMIVSGEESEILCSCGNKQCWEAFASNRATVNRYNRLTKQKIENVEEIFALALGGNREASTVLDDTIRYLGLGIANLMVGLSPELVVIGGEIAGIWSAVESPLLETIKKNIRQELPPIRIMASTLGSHPTLRGAISLSLVNKFASAT